MKEYRKTTDKELWTNFRNGNKESFELLYIKYIDTLYRYGMQFTTNSALVEDAIHDVYVRLYNERHRLKDEVNPKFFLFTCLKNHLRNLLRHELFFERVVLEDNEYLVPTGEDSVINSILQQEIKEKVAQVLNVLTDRQREIMYYKYIEELSIEEIAKLMDINYHSVQNMIQRSMKRIREAFPLIIIFIIFYKKIMFE